MTQNELTKLTRAAFNDMCRDFSGALTDRGFTKTKTRLWVRISHGTIDVISLFREGSSYGAPIGGRLDIRLNSSNRKPGDTTEFLALIGPQSDVSRTRAGKYHLAFNVKSRHMYDRCLADLQRFVDQECEPWFREIHDSSDGESFDISDETRKALGIKPSLWPGRGT